MADRIETWVATRTVEFKFFIVEKDEKFQVKYGEGDSVVVRKGDIECESTLSFVQTVAEKVF